MNQKSKLAQQLTDVIAYVWKISSVRGLIFIMFVVVALPAILIGLPFTLPAMAHGLQTPVLSWKTFSTTGVLFFWLLIAAQVSFMLAIRITQQQIGARVNGYEFGASGALSANSVVLVGILLFNLWVSGLTSHGELISTATILSTDALRNIFCLLLYMAFDIFLCVKVDCIDMGEYKPSYSVQEKPGVKPADPNRPPVPDLLGGARIALDSIEFDSINSATTIAQLIPAQCPFERDIMIGKTVLFSVPALCKLNPLYDECSALRFRALNFLAEKEVDISDLL